MKLLLIALCAIIAVCTARVVINADDSLNPHLLGQEECTWGPSYWCENIKTASQCNATKHCIKSTWNDMIVPEDNDSVCTICKDMVQQARDQLESNQTQEDLKAVFEGSCILIRIKPIVKECISLVDQFIPELVETLASQMNPSVVCSVAGLCNSARMDKLLEEAKSKVGDLKTRSLEKDELVPDECSKCNIIGTHLENKLHDTPRSKILEQMLNLCAELGTYSDACSATILTYFDAIYAHLQATFNAKNICHLSGQCSDQYHKHEDTDKTLKVEIRPLSSVGMVEVNDDLPCKLCEQLVGHLRDLLVANTTEAEFEQVLKGLCKQTKSFATECTAIVDEYYPEMYKYLTETLNSNAACEMIGICTPTKAVQSGPIWPLIPKNAAKIGMSIFQDVKKVSKSDDAQLAKSEVEAMQLPIERLLPFPLFGGDVKKVSKSDDAQLTKSEVEAMQLPIERLSPFSLFGGLLNAQGTETCELCEYVLHYLQEVITNPTTEEKVKDALGKVCNKLPESIQGQCTEFIDVYGDAVVAILAQEIDPSQVCPMLGLCPSKKLLEIWKNIPGEHTTEDETSKPGCPLCLLAMTQIYGVLKNNKTEANIEAQLDKLCNHLPHSLVEECTQLVKGYSKEIIELMMADLTPQEICVFIKLCDAESDPKMIHKSGFTTDKNGEISNNEIPDASISSEVSAGVEDPYCVLCELAMHYIDKALGDEKEIKKIEHVVHEVCDHLPQHLSVKCNKFVDQYADIIISLLAKDVSPKQVCSMIALCASNMDELKASVTECAVCKASMSAIDELLDNGPFANSVKSVVLNVCKRFPENLRDECTKLIDSYGQSIINLLKDRESISKVCGKIGVCAPNDYSLVSLDSLRIKRSYEKNRIKQCTWGPTYWCSSNETAHECKAVEHCKEHVWKDNSPHSWI